MTAFSAYGDFTRVVMLQLPLLFVNLPFPVSVNAAAAVRELLRIILQCERQSHDRNDAVPESVTLDESVQLNVCADIVESVVSTSCYVYPLAPCG